MRATLHTSHGDIIIELYPDAAPEAVTNFTGLACGTTPYVNPNASGGTSGPFYDGCTFHNVIRDFIIQGGDPTGTGAGGPGYEFPDENTAARFDRPYLVATAGWSEVSHGSQFFITLAAGEQAEHLNGRHTIFGEVTPESWEVVDAINDVPTNLLVPITPVIIHTVTVQEE